MLYQEYKSKYWITEHVAFRLGEFLKTGIILAVKFRYRSTTYDIVDDETGLTHEDVKLADIEGKVKEPDYILDNRTPNVVELENNLFTDRMGSEGSIIFGKPTNVLAPPHVSGVDMMINSDSPNVPVTMFEDGSVLFKDGTIGIKSDRK